MDWNVCDVMFASSALHRIRGSNDSKVDVMANLNLQPAPRSMGGSRSGFTASLSGGHVTPTSGMFTPAFTPGGQLSPSRLSSGRGGSLFSRSALAAERRQVSGLGSVMQDWNSSSMGSVANFGMMSSRSYSGSGTGTGSMANFHSVFSGADSSTPPLLDLSEFPSLTNRGGASDSIPPTSTLQPGKQPYVGMVKQPTSESSEFTMSSEDFPALPGSEGTPGVTSGEKTSNDETSRLAVTQTTTTTSSESTTTNPKPPQPPKRGIQTSPDGKVTNIPSTMVKDQFGMVGLLTFIRAAETDPNLVSLALGQDLTALGLNLNSPDNLYPTFGGPWAETPMRAQDIDYHVPPEYIINHSIRDKLAQLKLTRYKEDLLFFMYYTNAGDMLQLAAAAELYSREWRYHMEEKVWITQAPGCGVIEKTSTYERGTYYFFDAQNWRKVVKEFYLDYSKLENQPTIPAYHAV